MRGRWGLTPHPQDHLLHDVLGLLRVSCRSQYQPPQQRGVVAVNLRDRLLVERHAYLRIGATSHRPKKKTAGCESGFILTGDEP